MSSEYQVIYFQARALGEVTRLLFSYGDIKFDDIRVDFESEWPNLKSTVPFGKLPILKRGNDKVGHQSIAMARYAAKQVNLIGKDDWENLEIDAIVDTINDFRGKIAAYSYEKDDGIKAHLKGPLFDETIPYYMEKFEQIVKANNGHFAVGRLTWADFYWTGMVDYLSALVGSEIAAYYPNVKSVVQKVEEIPNVKRWIEKRPKTLL